MSDYCPHCGEETVIGDIFSKFCKEKDCDYDDSCGCEICTSLVKEL